jgi:hypothetical protein
MRVPQYGAQKVQLDTEPSARITAVPTPDTFGAGIGDVVSRLGAGFANDLAAKHKQQADESALLDFDNQTAAFEAATIYDPQTGVLNTVKGKDAVGLSQKVGGQFDQFTGPLMAQLMPDQQMAAAKLASQRRQGMTRTLDSYGSQQIDAYDKSVTEDGLTNSINLAVANAAIDPARVNTELQRQQMIVHGYAQHQGLSPEATQAMLTEVATKTHIGVVNQLLASDQDQAAQVYFDQHKDEIAGTALTSVEEALKRGSTVGESQRQSDLIMQHVSTLKDALDLVQTIQDPKLRDATEERVTRAWSLKEEGDRQQEESLMKTAANAIDANPAKGAFAIPPATWSSLSVGQRTQLELYAKRNAPGETGIVTDQPTYYRLYSQASTAPAEFEKVNLLDYLTRLDKADFKQLVELQGSVRKKDGTVDDKLDGFRTNEQIFNDTLTTSGIDPKVSSAGNGANDQEIAKLRKALDDKVMSLQRMTGKKATNEDVQGLMDGLVQSVVTQKGSWFGLIPFSGVPLRDQSKRVGDLTAGDIPAATRAHLVELLKGAGRPVTEDSVLNLYLAGLRKSGAIK